METAKCEQSKSWVLVNYVLKYGIVSVIVSCVYLCLRSRERRKQWQQRFFSWIFSRFSSSNLGEALDPFKQTLFASLKETTSFDPLLAERGPGHLRILEIGAGSGSNLKYYPKGSTL